MGIKKKIFLGWLALEIMAIPLAIPTAAKIFHGSLSSPLPRVASVALETKPGTAHILVASDGAFTIVSRGAQGDVQVNLHMAGKVNGNVFGKHAQKPGALQTCRQTSSLHPNVIYTSIRATAPNSGLIIDQAILVEISYDTKFNPVFSIETVKGGAAKSVPKAPICAA